MENLFIKPTHQTPMVAFNTNGELLLEGISLPVNVHDFYEVVFKWVEKLNDHLPPNITITLNFEYFNTSSSLTIHGILKKLISYSANGVNVKVIWKYDLDDEDMYDEGLLFQSRINHKIDFVAKQSDKDEN